MGSVIIALDLGTTGNRAIAFSKDGRIQASSYYEFPQIFPEPAWVEHNPMDIWDTTLKALNDVIHKVGIQNVTAIGIANQRETTILWNKKTGKPVYNAIVWQDRRTADTCITLQNHSERIKQKTGLHLDAYFSATKIKWLLDHVEDLSSEIDKGNILFGTVDTWILWKLTGVHATEPSNASRTLLFNIHTLEYDPDLLKLFDIPRSILPEIKESCGEFGITDPKYTQKEIPITGILGDQQAALFAQGGWEKGVIKNTYGTGLFLMAATQNQIPDTGQLINTVGWTINGQTTYAVEGSVFIGGSVIQWLRDQMGIIKDASESEKYATSIEDNEGVYFVPALQGLGAPYWDSQARGIIIGLTRHTQKAHIVRAALEAICYQTKDVVDTLGHILPEMTLSQLRVDGGASQNQFLMQFQADILGVPVERPTVIETTAFGAAGIAGIGVGLWHQDTFLKSRQIDHTFAPNMSDKKRVDLYQKWTDAVNRSKGWESVS
ncbi:MAG: glycerol kinase GlpK [Candidatus Margulisbacteria bacterium]|nr:glycerol kinase GlpK [Candidatus Margulisiibacteriota bacterium]